MLSSMPPRPSASSNDALRRMRHQPQRDTQPELALRRELHRLGLRYRVQQRPLPALRRTLDVVFRPARVAVDIRGCFWHGCPEHSTRPKANRDWWDEKLDANRRRDEDTARRLVQDGWILIVVWEHENPICAAARVASVVNSRRSLARTRRQPISSADRAAQTAEP